MLSLVIAVVLLLLPLLLLILYIESLESLIGDVEVFRVSNKLSGQLCARLSLHLC